MAALVVALALPAPGSAETALAGVRGAVEAAGAREAIARVAYAEAAGQGEVGLAAVVFTILNRLAAGQWGSSVDAVVNARAQFEPVLRAGGDWRALTAATPAERARIDTILNLALEGRLPDPTGGALYFQNPAIVAARARAGTVSAELVHFGGATPSATIGDHAFYAATGWGRRRTPSQELAVGSDMFWSPSASPSSSATVGLPSLAGERGLFVLPDGQIIEDRAALPSR